jgi:hypothetical protein
MKQHDHESSGADSISAARPDHYRHWLPSEDADSTLCGIVADVDTNDLLIACDCRKTDCRYPVTCPACLALLNGRVS